MNLWRKTAFNTLWSLLLFALLFLLLWLAESVFPALTLLKWSDAAWCVGIPASIIGVAYVLTIRDPQNYTGFYPGILMSALLAVQFFLQGNYDLVVLYICVFTPFQVLSIINWKKLKQATADSAPEFLNMKQMLLSVLVFILIVIVDWLVDTYLINHDAITDGAWLKLFGSLMIASAVFANFWLIYKKNDAWVYWFIYSISGILFYVVIGNAFSIVLFIFFLVINLMAGVAWIKSTPRSNYGWLKGK